MIHVSAHSFTPALHHKVRMAAVGLLYDPARPGEVRLAAKWKVALAHAAPELRVGRNYPYAGTHDGLMPYLRARFRPHAYVGIETRDEPGDRHRSEPTLGTNADGPHRLDAVALAR